MPLFEESPTPKNNQTEPATNSPTSQPTPSPGLFSLPDSVMKLVPWIPFALEAATGQKIPHMTGTIAEIQLALTHLQTGLQTVVNNQSQLAQRLIALETNANNHLTNLTQQFQSLRLTHTKEHKQIEFDSNPNKLENQEY